MLSDTKKIQDSKLTQDDINRVLWKACDTFRGVVDPSEYKNFILVFLFLKYLSDVWKDHYEECKRELGDDEVRIRRRMERERFILPEHSSYDYVYSKRNEANIGEIINKALESIEEANKIKLEGVFRNIDFNSESSLGQTKDRNKRLKHLIEDFADPALDLRPCNLKRVFGESPEDIIGNAYLYLISKFASDAGKKGGEFYTPREVSILLAKLLHPKKGNRIYDPTCGSGSLLIRVAEEIGDTDYAIYGQESNGSTWALAKMNMFLHGIDNAKIEWGDTINNPKLIEKDHLMKFDIVVANPPFSLDKWGADHAKNDLYRRFTRGVPPKSKGDYAFILHMIESAYEGKGRIGVIVPHGVLFRGGAEGKIRQSLVEENMLDAVIGLPPNLFYGTGIPTAILIFDRSRNQNKINKEKETILFIDSSRQFEEGKSQNRHRDQDINKIIQTYNTRNTIEKYSYLATLKEIEDNEFNLNIPRYIDTFEEEKEINICSLQKEIIEIEKELTQIHKQMNRYLEELEVNG